MAGTLDSRTHAALTIGRAAATQPHPKSPKARDRGPSRGSGRVAAIVLVAAVMMRLDSLREIWPAAEPDLGLKYSLSRLHDSYCARQLLRSVALKYTALCCAMLGRESIRKPAQIEPALRLACDISLPLTGEAYPAQATDVCHPAATRCLYRESGACAGSGRTGSGSRVPIGTGASAAPRRGRSGSPGRTVVFH